MKLGREWTLAGQPLTGLRGFDEVDEALRRMGARFGGSGAREMRMSRALAWLRLGEQENCLTQHHAESCILPLRGGAIHRNTRGSRGAVTALTEQLEATPEDLAARWLLNIAFMTLGEWPEKLPPRWLVPPKVVESEHDLGRFPDVGGGTGLDVNDLAGGCVLDDFDNDGLIDVVASSWALGGQLRWFRNEGNGSFHERTAEAGLAGITGGLNLQQTDYNNDGWTDLWVLRGGWWGTPGRFPNSLLRNNVACADYDNDGRPDLYLSCRSGANLLFRNEGPAMTNAPGRVTWKFTNTSRAAGVFEELESFPT